MTFPDPKEVAVRLIKLYGGRERFSSLMEQRRKEFDAIWEQDAAKIGRVLRAHLAVEHFITEHIAFANPKLGALEKARLSFIQKVELLVDDDAGISFLKPGLRRLNTIRNRIAHKLRVDIRDEDREEFLGIGIFKALRDELARGQEPKPDDPLSVLEQFAMFAASLIHGDSKPERDLWRQAMQMGENAQPSLGGDA